MSGASVFCKVRQAIGRFAAARQGNVAVIFALSAIPIITFVGTAIDYTRATTARTSMQAALDSTALMLSKDLTAGTISSSDIQTKASEYFAALYTNKDAIAPGVVATYTPPTSSTAAKIELAGTGSITTDFMRIAGYNSLGFGTSATTTWGNIRMRVALVLDVTGSMADDGKMNALKPAAKALVDQLSALAKTNGDIYISLVPFSKDVRMGTSFKNASWIDWTDWDANNGNWNCTSSNSYGCNNWVWTPASHDNWTGCFTDRTQDYDVKNTAPTPGNTATLFPASQYSYCDNSGNRIQNIMALTYDWSALKTRIDALVPTGNTNQGIGLAWGWMTLTNTDPFNAPAKDPNFQYKDAIVILSDGLNTQNRWYNSSQAAQIDARQRILCDNAKQAGITIYTVQVNTGGDPTSAVLQYCAQNTSSFYLVTSASQTASVFSQIGNQLSRLRVSK